MQSKEKVRILVCGGRTFGSTSHERLLFNKVMTVANRKYDIECIIQGGAKGADRLAKIWVEQIPWIASIEEKADWDTHGKKAGILRNQAMLDDHKPTLVIAFPGGIGTADMVRRSKAINIKVVEVK